jgi:CheY-like chemotaxis protein
MHSNLPSIWIIDDDAEDRYIVEYLFNNLQAPFTLQQFSDGQELLPALQASSELPNLILLDLNLDPLDGFSVLEALRSDQAYQHVPVFIYTSSSFEMDKVRSVQLDATGFITKPDRIEDLKERLRELIAEWIDKN